MKYLKLKIEQDGGADLLDSLGLDSPKNNSSKPFLDVEAYRQTIKPREPQSVTKESVEKMANFSINSSSPSSPSSPSRPSSPSSPSEPSKTTDTNIYLNSPLYSLTHDLRIGDRVMKTKFTLDPYEGILGDRGTVISTDFLHNVVAIEFDRLYTSGIISYVPSWALTRVFDPVPRRPKLNIRHSFDDDFDNDFDNDFDDDKPSKKTSKKPSKKTSKKPSKKTSKKPSKKTSKKPNKKTSKKPSKKTNKLQK